MVKTVRGEFQKTPLKLNLLCILKFRGEFQNSLLLKGSLAMSGKHVFSRVQLVTLETCS